jgi:hypothetical protein
MRRHFLATMVMFAILGCLQPPSLADGLPSHDLAQDRSTTITIYDPQDTRPCDFPPDCAEDIRSVSLRTYTGGTGRRMLAIRVEAYKLYGGLVVVESFKLRFDASGGPQADWYVLIALAELPPGHIGWACGRSFGTERYRLEDNGDSLTCLIPERDLHPTRSIRFQALWRANREVGDRAPDEGWAG